MRILVIEDSQEIVDTIALCFELRWPGVEVISTPFGKEGLDLVENKTPDLIVLDLGLPDMDGFDVLTEIRSHSYIPVIIVTVRGEEIDKIRGLELGADDYVTKPFSHVELLARIQAVLRRTSTQPIKEDQKSFNDNRVKMDFNKRTITIEGQPINLTPTEYNLLSYLAINAGTTLTHRALLEKVWGEEYIDSPDYLKVYIQRLRNKIEKDPSNPNLILSQRGVGYKLSG